MSIRVEPSELEAAATAHGPAAYVVTVGGDGRPRVVHVAVTVEGSSVTCHPGRSTRRNVAAGSPVTLVWPPATDGFSLIADGTGRTGGDASHDPHDDDGTDEGAGVLVVEVTSAVRHRPAPPAPGS